MKRYKALNFEYDDDNGTGTAIDIIECQDGEFVKYEDAKQQIDWLVESLKELMSIVKIHSENTYNNFVWVEYNDD